VVFALREVPLHKICVLDLSLVIHSLQMSQDVRTALTDVADRPLRRRCRTDQSFSWRCLHPRTNFLQRFLGTYLLRVRILFLMELLAPNPFLVFVNSCHV